jgi:hypothetical protein
MEEKQDETMVIDLEVIKEELKLNETLSDAAGFWMSTLLKATYGVIDLPFRLAGQKSDIKELVKALGMEKRYLNVAKAYGLTHPTTYKSKATLNRAAKGFTNKTGIPWPFK